MTAKGRENPRGLLPMTRRLRPGDHDMIVQLLHTGRTKRAEMQKLARAIVDCYGRYGIQVRCQRVDSLTGGDAVHLLRHLGRALGRHVTLCIVDWQIALPHAGPVFGCATGRSALLSRAGLEEEALMKEALHEVGHLLALDHCPGECVMSLSISVEQVKAKPSFLCTRCSALLESADLD
ncbi:MAG: hypothetical protein GKC10_09440 [Methanosarcinales archaeon]|nr:hypothetical protein [Methanosarcinales archaeon]